MLENLSKRQKILAAFVILVFIGVICYTAVTLVSRIGKIAVEITYAPFIATVKINGKTITNNATNYLVPGTYELSVSLEHFESIQKTITISETEKTIVGILASIGGEGSDIAAQHSADYLKVEGIMGRLAAEAGSEKIQSYPILQYLPINNMLYSISFQTQNDGSPKINIKAAATYIDAAVSKIYALDSSISPADYSIEVVNLKNPFSPTATSDGQASNGINYLKKLYPNAVVDYEITGEPYGEYFGAILRYTGDESQGFSKTFRAILRNQSEKWELLCPPYPILSKFNAPDLPTDLLNTLNRL